MIQEFITTIRELIEEELDINVYTPDLPEGTNIACITILPNSVNINNLCGLNYSELQFRILIRAKKDDNKARQMIDSIHDLIHLRTDLENIINIIADVPAYAGRDENNNIYYNITAKALYKKEEI